MRVGQEHLVGQDIAPGSRTRRPGLNVTQRISPGNTALSRLSAAVSAVGSSAQYGMREKSRVGTNEKIAQIGKDQTRGKTMRVMEDLTGIPADLPADVSQDVKQGYEETDSLLKAQDFEQTLSQEAAKLEPGDNIEEFLQQHQQEFLKSAGYAGGPDSKTPPKILLEGMERGASAVKAQFHKQEFSEMVTRQQENLMQMVHTAFTQGQPVTAETLKSIYAYAGGPKFAYLTKPEVDSVVAAAAHDALTSGKGDPTAIIGLLTKKREDGTPGLYYNPKFTEALDAAGRAGQRLADKATKEAQAGEEAEAITSLRRKADSLTMTNRELNEVGDKYGWTAWQRAAFEGRQDNARLKQAAGDAMEDSSRKIIQMVDSGDDARLALVANTKQVSKIYSKHLRDVFLKNPDVRSPEFKKGLEAAAAASIDIPWVGQMLSAFNPNNPQLAETTQHLYSVIKGIDPDYVSMLTSAPTEARLKQFESLTEVQRMSPEEAMTVMRNSKALTKDEANPIVHAAMVAGGDDVPTIPGTGTWGMFKSPVRNAPEVHRDIEKIATEIAMSGQTYEPDKLYELASERYAATSMVVGGQSIRKRQGLKGADAMGTELLKELAVKRKLSPQDSYFMPSRENPNKWLLKDSTTGFPVFVDGKPVAFDAEETNNRYKQYTADKNLTKATKEREVEKHRQEVMAAERTHRAHLLGTLNGRFAKVPEDVKIPEPLYDFTPHDPNALSSRDLGDLHDLQAASPDSQRFKAALERQTERQAKSAKFKKAKAATYKTTDTPLLDYLKEGGTPEDDPTADEHSPDA